MAHPISEEVFYNLADFSDPRGQPLSKKISDTSKTTRIGDDETIAMMMADPEVKKIVDRVFAHAKFQKPKTNTPIPDPPEDFDKEITARSKDIGYKAGMEDYDFFAGIEDDKALSDLFLEKQKQRAEQLCPDEYANNNTRYKKYYNAFVRGYESGVNMPVKKITSGKADGKAFVSEIRKEFGNGIEWTRETSPKIRNFVNTYLNDIDNIPADCRCALYRKYQRLSGDHVRRDLQERGPRRIPGSGRYHQGRVHSPEPLPHLRGAHAEQLHPRFLRQRIPWIVIGSGERREQEEIQEQLRLVRVRGCGCRE